MTDASPDADGQDKGDDRPLAGLLVVDLSRYLPGPLTTRLLADLGARVIKLEEPKLGDPVRQAIPQKRGQSSLAALLLSGHESLALDLKNPRAAQVVEELLPHADVLVESFRPGTLERLGLAPRRLRQRFPRLVICSLTGWGQDGPRAHRAGHDLTYQAIAGSLAATGSMPAVQVADLVGAWSAVTAILAALYNRQRSGAGCWIDQALLDAAGHANLTAWASEADGPKAVAEALPLTGALPCYDLYPTRDGGLLALGALEPRFWQRFCRAVERRDLLHLQYSRRPENRHAIAELIRSRNRQEWAELMAEHDLPVDPVLSAAEALAEPQVAHRDLVRRGPDQQLRAGFPALFNDRRPRGGEVVPRLGEHSRNLVEEFGLSAARSRRQRRAAGLGRRFSLKRWILRWVGAVVTGRGR